MVCIGKSRVAGQLTLKHVFIGSLKLSSEFEWLFVRTYDSEDNWMNMRPASVRIGYIGSLTL